MYYYLSDHLGSTSLEVSASGVIENESEYYPWGGELQIASHDPVNHYKFTGKERSRNLQPIYLKAAPWVYVTAIRAYFKRTVDSAHLIVRRALLL